LDDARLRGLLATAGDAEVAALVEVHDERELERALGAGARVVGVNNRDLSVFRTDLAVSERLAGQVPADVVLVGESGIASRADVERLGRAGVDAILMGETLMRAPDPAAALLDFVGCSRQDGAPQGGRPAAALPGRRELPRMTQVKVCGLCRPEDAAAAVAAGASHIGVILSAQGPRALDEARARSVLSRRGSARAVGVLVDEPVDRIAALAE